MNKHIKHLDPEREKPRHKSVFEFRPDKFFKPGQEMKLLRYAGGKWIEDDGEYDLAFCDLNGPMAYYVDMPYKENLLWSYAEKGNWGAEVEEHPRGNAWHYMTTDNLETRDYYERDEHPNEIASESAMKKCSSIHRIGNGRSVSFHPNDPTIMAKLLRYVGTKEIVAPPYHFDCIYCGSFPWEERENETYEEKERRLRYYKYLELRKEFEGR